MIWDKERSVPTLSVWMPYVRDERAPTRFSVRVRNRGMLGGGGEFTFELP